MRKLIALAVILAMVLSLSAPAMASDIDVGVHKMSLQRDPLFATDYDGVQIVNELVEQVPNSNICYVYHDLSNGNSIAYMLKNNEVVYKGYVDQLEHRLTEYTYTNRSVLNVTTEVFVPLESMAVSAAAVSYTDVGQIKYRTPLDHLGTIYTKYLNCSYRSEYEPESAYNVAREAANKAAYASFLATLIGIPVGIASTLAGVIMGIFGLAASAVGFAIPEHILLATKTTMYWKLEDSVSAVDRYTYSASKYVITDEEQLDEVYQDMYYFEPEDFEDENASMASYFKQLIYQSLNLEAVDWIHE